MNFNFGYMNWMDFDNFFFPGFFISGVIGALLLAFWVWMLIDCLRRDFKGNEKIVWVLVIIFAKIIGALVYFFVVKNRKK